MKKTTFAFFLLAALSLSGCSIFEKLSEVEYNNQIVEGINESSGAIEVTATLYNETIPDVVSEKDTVVTTTMQEKYESAQDSLKKTQDLSEKESRNIEQQNAVRTGLETYLSAAEQYLESYQAMLTYYGEETYKEDVSKVKIIDEKLHTSYTTFIQANNDLVDALEMFVSSNP